MIGLDCAQLVEQRVVLVVADYRVVEDVIAAIVLRQLPPQLLGALLGRRPAHTEVGALAASISSKPQPRRLLQSAVIGEVEVDRRHRDPLLCDRVEIGALDLLIAGLPTVDLVATPVAVLAD